MKRYGLILLFFSLIVFLFSCEENPHLISEKLCAHRGFHENATENSLQAFRDAITLGCTWAELDIWCTSDSYMVVSHDNNLFRCFNKNVNISNCTLSQLRTYVSSEQVPQLTEVLAITNGEIKLQIEIKDINAVTPLLELFASTPSLLTDCIVISFNAQALIQIKEANSAIQCGLLLNAFTPSVLSYNWADIIAINQVAVTASVIQQVHKSGKKIYVWTVDNAPSIKSFLKLGTDMITTNRPDLFF